MSSENSKKLKKLDKLIYVAIGLFLITLVIYLFKFNNGLSSSNADWGTFGDFMGGTLNPLFALFSLFAIIYTIKIQTEELELSREELEATREELTKSREAQEQQSESFKIQNKSIKLQSFENTFFQLNDLLIHTKNQLSIKIVYNSYGRILINNIEIGYSESFIQKHYLDISGEYKASDAIKWYLLSFKEHYQKNYDLFNKDNETYTGAYFGQLYQILKFIDNSEIEKKQRYVNIFRAQFTKEELELLFYHCLGKIGKTKFKPLVEKYEFFEHVIHSSDIDKPLGKYNIKAFGKNKDLIDRYNGISHS